jgi:hypothetical protein
MASVEDGLEDVNLENILIINFQRATMREQVRAALETIMENGFLKDPPVILRTCPDDRKRCQC